MSLFSQQTVVLTQNYPVPAVYLVASFRSFLVTDPTTLAAQGAIALMASSFAVCRVDVARKLAFIGNGVDVLHCVDISNPFDPVLRDSLTIGFIGLFGDQVGASAFIGNNVFLLNTARQRIHVVDASNPDLLVETSEFILQAANGFADQPGPVDIRSSGNLLYVINYDINSPPTRASRLSIIDASDPSNLTQRGSVSWGVPAFDQPVNVSLTDYTRQGTVLLNGNFAYAVVAGQLHIVNIANSDSPVTVSSQTVDPDAFALGINEDASRAVIMNYA